MKCWIDNVMGKSSVLLKLKMSARKTTDFTEITDIWPQEYPKMLARAGALYSVLYPSNP